MADRMTRTARPRRAPLPVFLALLTLLSVLAAAVAPTGAAATTRANACETATPAPAARTP